MPHTDSATTIAFQPTPWASPIAMSPSSSDPAPSGASARSITAAVRKRPDSTTAIAAAGSASRRSISRRPTAIAARWATSALAAIGCVSGRSAALTA